MLIQTPIGLTGALGFALALVFLRVGVEANDARLLSASLALTAMAAALMTASGE